MWENGGHAFHFLWKNHGEKSSFHGVVFVAIVRCTIRLTVCHGTSPVNTGLAEVRHWAMIDRAAQCATTRVVTRNYSKFSIFLLILAARTAYRTPTPTYTHVFLFTLPHPAGSPALHRAPLPRHAHTMYHLVPFRNPLKSVERISADNGVC